MKSYLAKKDEVERKWWLIDANDQTLGRMATQISMLLRGKTKPEFTPNIDAGDFVIVINAKNVILTGKKELKKTYHRHSGTPGGFKTETVAMLRKTRPEKIIKFAVKGMLPHTTLGEKQLTKLKIYSTSNHPHGAQKPKVWKLSGKK